MGKGRFLNQELGKRTSRKFELLKSRLTVQQTRNSPQSPDLRLPKKGVSRTRRSS